DELQFWFNCALTLATIVTAVATIVTAGIVLYQNRIMVESLNEQRKQGIDIQRSAQAAVDAVDVARKTVEASGKQAVAAEIQATAAKDAASSGKESNRLTEESVRARLVVQNCRLETAPTLNTKITVMVDVINSGHSTADNALLIRSFAAWKDLPDGPMPAQRI